MTAYRRSDVRPVNVRNYIWRVASAAIVLSGFGESTVKSTVIAAEPAGRWKHIHLSSGRLGGERTNASCDFNHRLRFDARGFDLSVELNQVAFILPPVSQNIPFRSCPSDRQEITITRIGFSRSVRRAGRAVGADPVSAAVAAAMYPFKAKTITRYFLSLDYRAQGVDEASATFYFEGQDPAALLTSLSRISKVPVDSLSLTQQPSVEAYTFPCRSIPIGDYSRTFRSGSRRPSRSRAAFLR